MGTPTRCAGEGTPAYGHVWRLSGAFRRGRISLQRLHAELLPSLPEVVQLEIPRWSFDEIERMWIRDNDRARLGEIPFLAEYYTLRAIVMSSEDSQQHLCTTMISPDGRTWSMFPIGSVIRLTHRHVFENTAWRHCVGVYTRNQARQHGIQDEPEAAFEPDSLGGTYAASGYTKPKDAPASKANDTELSSGVVELTVVDSRIFEGHKLPGLVDVHDPSFDKFVCKVVIEKSATMSDLWSLLRTWMPNVISGRIWPIEQYDVLGRTYRASMLRPSFTHELQCETIVELISRCPHGKLWLHETTGRAVIDRSLSGDRTPPHIGLYGAGPRGHDTRT